mmetsp:Transcript_29729/g.39557  ORF Transcript_29729/g.39557 Transcript_29729/m.39557 type:complete len:1275 (-) Transcript_29729:989-4813(-)
MFSSITKYTSPKQFLVSYLSRSFADFFDVDPSTIETSLLKDARVALIQIQIKERRIGKLLVSGSVEKMEFSWVWNRQSLINDAKLAIEGVQVHVDVVEIEDEHTMAVAAESSITTTNQGVAEDREATTADWKAKYLQQILNHLTLIVRDVEISIHFNNISKVVLQGIDIELKTKSEVDDKLLMQVMSVFSLEAWIDGSDGSKYPLLDPFGYRADVQRVSGRRFLDGILAGLLIQGHVNIDESLAASTIRVHAGVQQITALRYLQGILLSIGSENNGERAEPKIPSAIDKGPTSEAAGVISSIFCLPVKSMEVVLENQTNLRLAGCTIRYCTDGTELSIDCTDGIWMDDLPLSLNNLWVLDFINSEVMLDSLQQKRNCYDTFNNEHSVGEKEQNFHLELSLDMFEKIYSGVQAILPQCKEAMTMAEKASDCHNISSLPPPWVTKVNGSLTVHFSGMDDLCVDIAVDSLNVTQGDISCPFYLECQSICVGSKSKSHFLIYVPEIETVEGILIVQDHISVTIGSTDAINDIQRLWTQIMSVMGDTSSSSLDMPISIRMPGVNLSMKEPELTTVKMSNIQGNGSIWKFEQIVVDGFGALGLEATALEASIDIGEKSLRIQQIQKLSFGYTLYLAKPLFDVRVVFDTTSLSVACKVVEIEYPESLLQKKEVDVKLNPTEESKIPLPIVVTIESLSVKSGFQKSGDFQGLKCNIKPAEMDTFTSIECCCESVVGQVEDAINVSFAGFHARGEFIDHDEPSLNDQCQTIVVPGFGQLSSAIVQIHEISEVSTSKVGFLTKPIAKTSITFKGKNTNIECNTGTTAVSGKYGLFLNFERIEWKIDSSNAPIPALPGGETTTFSLPKIPVRLVAQTLNIRYGFAKLCCGKISLGFQPDPFGAFNRVSAQANALQIEVDSCVSVSTNGINVVAQFTPIASTDNLTPVKFSLPVIGTLSRATIKINEVHSLNVFGLGSLSTPTKNLFICFENDSLSIHCPSICLLKEEAQILTGSENGSSFDLPCNTKISFGESLFQERCAGGGVFRQMNCHALDLALEPAFSQVVTFQKGSGARIDFKCSGFESIEGSKIARVQNITASGQIQFDQKDRIGNLMVECDRAELNADFSSVDWAAPCDETVKPSNAFKLPFAQISPFDLTLKYTGELVNLKDATLSFDAFEGDILTTLESLQSHYVGMVKQRIPFLLANTEVAGVNVGDNLSSVAGRIALRSSIIGSTVGVVAKDAIGGAIAQGKSARGASSTQKYKFGEYCLRHLILSRDQYLIKI